MMSLATLYFPAGVGIGLGAAAPVGPVNLLVIQRSLAAGRGPALVLGAGAALGDCAFAAVAAFGLGAIGGLVAQYDAAIRIIGGAMLLGFALVVWRSSPHLDPGADRTGNERLALASLFLTITNPATLLFFVGSFGAIGFLELGHDTLHHRINAALIVSGVASGSMLWWLVVSGIAVRLRDRVSDAHLRLLNHGTAAALGVFGVIACGAGVWRL